jgi:hypothetical protein
MDDSSSVRSSSKSVDSETHKHDNALDANAYENYFIIGREYDESCVDRMREYLHDLNTKLQSTVRAKNAEQIAKSCLTLYLLRRERDSLWYERNILAVSLHRDREHSTWTVDEADETRLAEVIEKITEIEARLAALIIQVG